MSISLFLGFLVLGSLLARANWAQRLQGWVKLASTTTLLLFIFLMFGELEFPRNNLLLILLGGLLQAVPALIGMILGPRKDGAAFLLFSTYGGGNRGTLAVTLLMPSLLPEFMLLDLGNLLSLILLFQLSASRFATGSQKGGLKSLGLTIAAIGGGIAMRQWVGATELLHQAFGLVKLLLVAVTSLQIGLSLKLDLASLRWVLASWWRVRPLALALPLLLLLILRPEDMGRYLPLLLLFAVLPISSMAASLLPTGASDEIKEKLSTALVGSNLLYIALLGLAEAASLVTGGLFLP